MKKVLVVIDMQNDFFYGALGTDDGLQIIPRVKHLTKVFENNNIPIIFTMDTHDEGYLDTIEGRALPIIHCLKESKGWEIVEELIPFIKNATTILKDGFGSKELISLVEDYDEIYLCGICTDICVVSNSLTLRGVYPHKKIVVLEDCCWGTSKANHDIAIQQMKNCIIEIRNIDKMDI